MKKIRIDTVVEVDSRVSTVGEELKKILYNMPCQDSKTAAKQVLLGKDLGECIEKKEEWFAFEEEFQSVIEAALDVAAGRASAILIGQLRNAFDAMVAFKGKEVKEEPAAEAEAAPETPAAAE